jgi:hypothetical protein
MVFFARVIRARTERAGDLLAAQTGHRAQRQRHPRPRRQHRVAGDEHQRQYVVVHPVGVPRQRVVRAVAHRRRARDRLALGEAAGQRRVALVERGAAAEGVDRAAPPGGQQPAHRVPGRAVARPGDQRLGQRLLGDVLGEGEITGVPGQRGDDPRGLDPPDRLYRAARGRGVRRPGAGRGSGGAADRGCGGVGVRRPGGGIGPLAGRRLLVGHLRVRAGRSARARRVP